MVGTRLALFSLLFNNLWGFSTTYMVGKERVREGTTWLPWCGIHAATNAESGLSRKANLQVFYSLRDVSGVYGLTCRQLVDRLHYNPKRIFGLPDQEDTYIEVMLLPDPVNRSLEEGCLCLMIGPAHQ